MSKPYRISVVIPCFNHGEFLGEAVDSAVGAKREDLELIVVDDGSTDERTRKKIEELCTQGIRVIRQDNKGLSGARNAGIVASRGEYIFPLDADDRMRSGWIDRGIKMLDSNPKVGVVYGDAECFGTRAWRWRTGRFDPDRLLYRNYIHATALYRRSVWEQNGGYDSAMDALGGHEDWDFWISALERGWKFIYVPEVFFEYRQATESMITRAQTSLEAVENFVISKHSSAYRRAWQRLAMERQSTRQSGLRLKKLLVARLTHKFKNDAERWVPG